MNADPKDQSQTLGSMEFYMPCHAFGYGQLYVALSRVRAPASNKLMISPDISEIEGHDRKHKLPATVLSRELFPKIDKKTVFVVGIKSIHWYCVI